MRPEQLSKNNCPTKADIIHELTLEKKLCDGKHRFVQFFRVHEDGDGARGRNIAVDRNYLTKYVPDKTTEAPTRIGATVQNAA